ncbi:aminotransferase class V-fold PLP-dependent enzyme [Alphaproteobacteria bacterium]|nr:aminotransferase class V-fold PLP-dependent enzyme [Alphaproteobacteria bacterium]
MSPALDLDFVRAQFPAFEQPSLDGQLFFENAGGSYTCRQVVDRLTRFYTQRKVQPYGPYEASRLGGEEMDEAQVRLAAALGVAADEVSFGPSTTQNTYVLSKAFGEMLSAGDAIIVTNQDHEANTGPWRRLDKLGIDVREWKLNPETGMLDVRDLENMMDAHVKLVCFPHCSNIVGAPNEVAAICEKVRAAGAYTCVDGVSYAPHGIPNVSALGPDIYLFSAYKTFGPHQGIMVVRHELADALPSQAHYFNAGYRTKKFTPAGPDHAQIAASAGMVDYIEALYAHHFSGAAETSLTAKTEAVHDLSRAYETEALQPLLDYLADRNSVRLIGPKEAAAKAPTVAVHSQTRAETLASALASRGVMAGGGDFYGVRCLEGLGIDPDHGVLRLSFVHYTRKEDVTALIGALDEVL